ncbi:MAG: hypothetical protein IJ397_09335 [Lachnospiraceae bacterium]|nr:hypothetical protein [Lachnospiraceae bacterium]
MKKGHITVYLTLVFTLILSVFLSAFEAVRGNYMKIRAENAVQTAIHSSFAEYHEVLFERYGLLFVDTSYMTAVPDYRKLEERLELYLDYNLMPEKEQTLLFARDWYNVEDYNVSLTNIRLATDDWGDVMRQQAVRYMGNYVGDDWLEEVHSWIKVTEEYDISRETFEEYHQEVLKEQEKCWKENNLLNEEWEIRTGLPSLDLSNTYMEPLFSEIMNYSSTGISTKTFNPMNHASHRWNIQGTGELEEEEFDVLEELLFGEYILQKMGNYRGVREDSKLDYQIEYILFGHAQDSMNLYRMQETLFLFRGAANLTMLLSDSETQKMIETISQLGVLINIPPEFLQAAVNVCWAAAESFDDVKKLMKGEEVLFLKEPKDFSVGLGSVIIGNLVNFTPQSSESEALTVRLKYEDYLRIFLYTQLPVVKVYRCMDMMEADIRLTEGNEEFRMDACADAVSMEVGIHSGYGFFYSLERKYSYF